MISASTIRSLGDCLLRVYDDSSGVFGKGKFASAIRNMLFKLAQG